MSEGAGSFSWRVELPATQRALGGPVPKGTLVMLPECPDEERIALPKAVARRMAAKQKAGELHVDSRAELLYHTGEVARGCARARIERLIDRREYSRHEVKRKLEADGYAPRTIEACLDRACAAGLVSDARFAEAFIRTKLSAGWGMQRIERELAQRGVPTEQLSGWPYDYLDPDDELDRALRLAETKRVSGQRAYEKLVRFLCGRGYSLGTATKAARLAMDERVRETA